MPNIFKGFLKPSAVPFQLEEVGGLNVDENSETDEQQPREQEPEELQSAPPEPSQKVDPNTPIDYAKVQADAILAGARREAEEILEREKVAIAGELDEIRENARREGYRIGLAEGMAGARAEAQEQLEQRGAELEQGVYQFLEDAAQARDEFMQSTQAELVDLALAVAEKIIQVSLHSSRDIVGRMIQSATEKLRRKEWVRIYIADCDAKGVTQIPPGLTASLASLSDHVRIIPMGDDEPGSCIIEMPDEIIDASVATQMANVREILREHIGGSS